VSRRYRFEHFGRQVEVDRAGQVIRAELDLDGKAGWRERPPEGLIGGQSSWQAPLHPSIAAAEITAEFTPLGALAAKAKAVDDRLMAEVERLAHRGSDCSPGLYSWLRHLRRRLDPRSPARELFDAAGLLAGDDTGAGGSALLGDFLADPGRSKPLGIYTASAELQRAFLHDRLLQTELSQEEAAEIREALEAEPSLVGLYTAHLDSVAGVTNPPAAPPVLDAGARTVVFLAASESLEGQLIKRLFQWRSIPEGFELGAELVERIRDGRLDTAPAPDDGWYAHQFHAIAALLSPETEGLEVGERYRELLAETFKALFALDRETHVKQLEIPRASGIPPLIVSPRLSVEPAPVYYERVAAAYGFIAAHLRRAFGSTAVDRELGFARELFAGAALTSRRELGEATEGDEAALETFERWQQISPEDPDLAADLRVAVPVFYDVERNTTRIAVTLGVETRTLRCEYVAPPRISVSDGSSPQLAGSEYLILAPITLECDVAVPPGRDELRAICDEHRSPEAIRAALEG
jgi:hypothetical protein